MKTFFIVLGTLALTANASATHGTFSVCTGVANGLKTVSIFTSTEMSELETNPADGPRSKRIQGQIEVGGKTIEKFILDPINKLIGSSEPNGNSTGSGWADVANSITIIEGSADVDGTQMEVLLKCENYARREY